MDTGTDENIADPIRRLIGEEVVTVRGPRGACRSWASSLVILAASASFSEAMHVVSPVSRAERIGFPEAILASSVTIPEISLYGTRAGRALVGCKLAPGFVAWAMRIAGSAIIEKTTPMNAELKT